MTSARVRLLAIAAPIISSSLAFLAWSQPWVEVVLTDGRRLIVGGDVAAPAIPPLAVAAFAVVGALVLAGVVFRVILGLLQALLGAGIAASGALTLLDPVQSAAASITAATGVEGLASVRELVAEVGTTSWPVLAIVAGAVAIVIGLGITATASRWPVRTRRYDAVRLASADEPSATHGEKQLDAWDALSDGDDPTTR